MSDKWPGWKRVICIHCNGSGHLERYTSTGSEFLGEDECRHCYAGYVWQSPRGRLALYPGGPFVGSVA